MLQHWLEAQLKLRHTAAGLGAWSYICVESVVELLGVQVPKKVCLDAKVGDLG